MDTNTMYAAALVGQQADYDDYIIKEVWKEDDSSFNNMTVDAAKSACEYVFEKQGQTAYSRCLDAGNSCGRDSICDALVVKYAKALSKGYSGTFEDFKKRSENLAALGQLGLNLLGGLISQISGGDQQQGAGDEVYDDSYKGEQPKSRTGLYVGLGLLAVVGIGVAIYYGTKNK